MRCSLGPPPKRSRSVSEISSANEHDTVESIRVENDGDLPEDKKYNARYSPSLEIKPASSLVSKSIMSQSLNMQDRCKPPPPPPAALTPHTTQDHNGSEAAVAPLEQECSVKVDMQDPNSRPDVKLPAEWILVWSKSKKRWYYFDKRKNSSVWEWPPPTT